MTVNTIILIGLSTLVAVTPTDTISWRALWSASGTYEELRSATGRASEMATIQAVASSRLGNVTAMGVPPLRILIVADASCEDSVQNIPVFQALVLAMPSLAMRVIPRHRAEAILANFPTQDGRRATPVAIFLGKDNTPVSTWVEHPQALKLQWSYRREAQDSEGWYDFKKTWYHQDGGRSTLDELLAILRGLSPDPPNRPVETPR